MRASAGGQPLLLRAPRIAGELVRRRGGEHQRLESGGLRQPRQHVAVAAVVAGAAHHRHAPRLGPASAQQRERRFGGTRHQREARHAALFDLVGVERAHLGGGVDGGRPVHRAAIILAAPHEPPRSKLPGSSASSSPSWRRWRAPAASMRSASATSRSTRTPRTSRAGWAQVGMARWTTCGNTARAARARRNWCRARCACCRRA